MTVPPEAVAAAAKVIMGGGDVAAALEAAAALMEPESYEPFIAAEGWREETEIRLVPESAVAEAVAAERERAYDEIRQLATERGALYMAPADSSTDGEPSGLMPFADLIGETP